MTRIRVRSPSVVRRSPKPNISGYRRSSSSEENIDLEDGFGSMNNNNKVMVVVDSGAEAKAALELALSHTVQTHDSILLLYVANQPPNTDGAGQAYELLCSLKNFCKRRRPGVNVELIMREGKKNRGGVIVEEAKKERVSLVVMGQRKRWAMWRLIQRLKSRRIHCGGESDAVVKYCIQNLKCLTIAVRRQGKKVGGYLITTKRHKNFWLLA
ncbi:hypothetical protein LINGRAHAP2_LOCUS9788 [Linum grandiflorum]